MPKPTTAALLGCLLVLGTTNTATAQVQRVPAKCQTVPAVRLCSIHAHHRAVNHLRQRMGLSTLRYQWRAEQHPGLAPWLEVYWTRRHRSTAREWRAYRMAPWLHGSWHRDALCIHGYEGSWTDPGAPYYGGLQMDTSFMASYGAAYLRAYGTADHWPVADQLHAAYRAWRVRSWTPWPSTAAACGLL